MTLSSPDRRRFLASAVFMTCAGIVEVTRADDVKVPLDLQAQLLAKSAPYDRGLPGRAKGTVRSLVLTKRGDAQSASVARRLVLAMGQLGPIAGMPVEQTIQEFSTAAAVAEACRTRVLSIVVLSSGFDNEVGDIAQALDGVSVLTVGLVSGYVPKRAVLGFDLVSGKPKLEVHLPQARSQGVAFEPRLLRLAKVFE